MTTLFTAAIPILPALNFDETIAFYGKIGFEKLNQYPDYAVLRRDGLELHFWKCDDKSIAEQSGCRFNVQDVESFYQVCNDLGIVHPNGKLEVKPWGLKEFAILDSSGNLVRFAERV